MLSIVYGKKFAAPPVQDTYYLWRLVVAKSDCGIDRWQSSPGW